MVDAPLDLGAVEEDCSEETGVASQVKHETKQTGTAQTAATVSMPQPAPATAPAPTAAPKKQEPVTLEDYLNTMTLEEAKNVRIDVGYYKGNTLGELALRKPSDLEWYVKNYSGRNLALKAGATVEVQVDELVSAFLSCKGKWDQIDPDRTMELLNILIDEKVNYEGGHGYRVVERLVELGFSKKELMVLKFVESDIDRALQEDAENV